MFNTGALQQFATPRAERMAMTFYEMSPSAPQKTGLIEAFFTRLTLGTQTIQYSKMVRALTALTDQQLNQIGISREEIPAHAHSCIYAD